jgi:hypothetical protein
VPRRTTRARMEHCMDTYIIRRRNAWKNESDLKSTAELSAKVGNEQMPDKVRWIRSYVLKESDGTLGTICVYQATGPEAIQEHARCVGMPADEITPVATAVIVREDPAPTQM